VQLGDVLPDRGRSVNSSRGDGLWYSSNPCRTIEYMLSGGVERVNRFATDGSQNEAGDL